MRVHVVGAPSIIEKAGATGTVQCAKCPGARTIIERAVFAHLTNCIGCRKRSEECAGLLVCRPDFKTRLRKIGQDRNIGALSKWRHLEGEMPVAVGVRLL